MKVVILAGGLGTRISEETHLKPKPLLEIGGMPILWHIMKIYGTYGFTDFIICVGYKGYLIKEFFANYYVHTSDITFDLQNNTMETHRNKAEPWRVTLVDTGSETQTGGRLKKIGKYLNPHEHFCMTYGDGVANIDVSKLVEHHKQAGRLASVTAVQPPGRFGALELNGNQVTSFLEKPQGDGGWINGGFYVLSPKVLDYIDGDGTHWERKPMERLAQEGQLTAYFHDGFWRPMDTLRDKMFLEDIWTNGNAPWKTW